MSNARVVLCEACGSEGRLFTLTHISREDGQWDGHSEPCPWCEGTGGEVIETQPIDMEDLEEMCGQ
ncbi:MULTISPECIES: hypothetical protein [unclassified Bradyrhizobium]